MASLSRTPAAPAPGAPPAASPASAEPFSVVVDASAWPRVRIAARGAPASNAECDGLFLGALAAQYTRARETAGLRRTLELELDISGVAVLRSARYMVNLIQFFDEHGALAEAVTVGTVIAVAPAAEAAVNKLVAMIPGDRPRAFVARGDTEKTERTFAKWRAARAGGA